MQELDRNESSGYELYGHLLSGSQSTVARIDRQAVAGFTLLEDKLTPMPAEELMVGDKAVAVVSVDADRLAVVGSEGNVVILSRRWPSNEWTQKHVLQLNRIVSIAGKVDANTLLVSTFKELFFVSVAADGTTSKSLVQEFDSLIVDSCSLD